MKRLVMLINAHFLLIFQKHYHVAEMGNSIITDSQRLYVNFSLVKNIIK